MREINVVKYIFQNITYILIILLFNRPLHAQLLISPDDRSKLDSLGNRIEELRASIGTSNDTRDAGYFYRKRELDIAVFQKQFEKYIMMEEIDNARALAQKNLLNAESRQDHYLADIYRSYLDRWNDEYKKYRKKYQSLFEKERNFKKEFNKMLDKGNKESCLRTKRMTELSIKYAEQNNFGNTLKYLNKYLNYLNVLIFDLESEYDLAYLTRRESNFEKGFSVLLSSDTLENIKEAGNLADYCLYYSENTDGKLDSEYFLKKKALVASTVTDYIELRGSESEMAQIADEAIIARKDTLNKQGVFKWHQYILVINSIRPRSSSPLVQQGEAIIHADKILSRYININKLGKLKSGDKIGYTYLIPFENNNKNVSLYYDPELKKWQYMVVYTEVVNEKMTGDIRKYLPPVIFEDEQLAESDEPELPVTLSQMTSSH